MQIGNILIHVNQLVTFPISLEQLKDWCISVDEILPDLELDDLKELINDFKKGKIDYDKNYGIQNIFTGLVAKFGGIYDK